MPIIAPAGRADVTAHTARRRTLARRVNVRQIGARPGGLTSVIGLSRACNVLLLFSAPKGVGRRTHSLHGYRDLSGLSVSRSGAASAALC